MSTASRPACRTKTNKLGFVAAKPIAIVLQQHQLVHARRPQDQPERDRAGDLHRRLVAAGARGGGHQRARRRRLRRHHLPRRRPEGRHRDGREARASRPAATTPRRRRSPPRASSPAPNTSGARSTRATPTSSPRARRCRTASSAATTTTWCRTRPSAPAPPTEARKAADGGDGRPQGQEADLRRPAEGQQGQGRHRQGLRQLRPLPRQDGLPARGRVGSTT